MRLKVRLKGRSMRRLSKIDRQQLLTLLMRRKRALLMQRLPELLPVERLAEIFRAQHGDKEAQRTVTIGEASTNFPAETFAEFLEVNKLPVIEEVLR